MQNHYGVSKAADLISSSDSTACDKVLSLCMQWIVLKKYRILFKLITRIFMLEAAEILKLKSSWSRSYKFGQISKTQWGQCTIQLFQLLLFIFSCKETKKKTTTLKITNVYYNITF